MAETATAIAKPASADPNRDDLKRDYLDYLTLKRAEIDEQKTARRYYHSVQWTPEQIKVFNRRKQPVVTYNRIARKVNAVVGLLEDQRQDPKAFARTPANAQGAEIATAVMRYIIDAQAWKEKSPEIALDGAVDAIAGAEITVITGDQGDPDIGLEIVEPSSFFYDPRSVRPDFSDARFMGVSKWASLAAVKQMFPDHADELDATAEDATDLTTDPDSDVKWWSGDGRRRKVRLVDHWYIEDGEWHYCVYTAGLTLASGRSYLFDEKQATVCKYVMFSAGVDQDGDRYGFVRGMRSAQDEINQRRAKGLHTLNSRRIIVAKGQVDDVEKFRHELARPDGVAEVNPGGDIPKLDDAARSEELQGQLAFLADAKAEIENYGFNPALIGTASGVASGKALQIQRQSGISELGPFLMAYRGWKLRVYRAVWNAAQQYWTGQRWLRVTHNPALARIAGYQQAGTKSGYLPINAAMPDPTTGQMRIVNALGALDMEIIVDEGPDEVTMAADLFETLKQVLPAIAPLMAPPVAQAALGLLISSSPLAPDAKETFDQAIQQGQQPDPIKQQSVMLELQGKQADNAKKMADARLSMARAMSEGQGQSGADPVAAADAQFRDTLFNGLVQLEIARIKAGAANESAALDAKIEALLGFAGLANDQAMQIRDHAHQLAMAQSQPQPVAAE